MAEYRKAAIDYGWDFNSRLCSLGIWKEAEIVFYNKAKIENVFCYTDKIDKDKKKARLNLEIKLTKIVKNSRLSLDIRVKEKKKMVWRKKAVSNDNFCKFSIEVKNPKLWQPWTEGNPFLYDLEIVLKDKNRELDIYHHKIGIRKVEVVREKEENGYSFNFKINNEKVFIMGSNWIPPSLAYSRIGRDMLRERLLLAKESGIMMLRVWGGGIYPGKDFYQICDELGILVWQDFMFACSIYPQNKDFLDLVRKEAEYWVKGLRNHASLSMWSGDNEVDLTYTWLDKDPELKQMGFGTYNDNEINRKVLKSVCKKYDPTRFFLVSSPSCPSGKGNPNDRHDGDCHFWAGHGSYLGCRAKFVSEFGIQSIASLDSIRKYSFINKGFDNYLKEKLKKENEFRNRWVLKIKEGDKGIEDFITQNQLYQAHRVKLMIELQRIRKTECGGVLYWKFNGPKPDSCDWQPRLCCAVDYYGRPKAVFYFTKKAYNKDWVCFKEENNVLSVWVSTEEFSPKQYEVEIIHGEFSGKILKKEKISAKADKTKSVKVKEYNLNIPDLKRDEEFFAARLTKSNKLIGENVHYLIDIEHLDKLRLPQTKPKIDLRLKKENEIGLKITCRKFVRGVRLYMPSIEVNYSDNFFDVIPGIEKQVFIKSKNGESLKGKALVVSAINSQEQIVSVAKNRNRE
jgi:beta-mannosidase